MANPYYDHTTYPATNSRATSAGQRAEFDSIEVGFDGVKTDMDAKAPLASPALTGNPTAPTPSLGDNDTSIATTAFVRNEFAPLASPALTGNPTAPTPTPGDNDTSIATTAFVQDGLSAKADVSGEIYSGTHDFTSATIRVPTSSAGASGPNAASLDFVNAVAFSVALPGQTGNQGLSLMTDGSNASWGTPPMLGILSMEFGII